MNVEGWDAAGLVVELVDRESVTPTNPELTVELLDELWGVDVIVMVIVVSIVVDTVEVEPAALEELELVFGADPPLELGDDEFE